jgi:pSer/pThr/pTyr-binding forkhead associated (FHA) protein
MAYFVLEHPDGRSEEYRIDQELLMIGRSAEANLRLDHAKVSRIHCELRQSADGTWLITDMGSRNGTLVNGQAVEQARLGEGDRVEIGGVGLVFHDD